MMKLKIIKFIFLLIILYSLFLFISKIFTINKENMDNLCNSCYINPRDSNCIKLKKINLININNINDLSYDIIDTSFVFCPWTNNCEINNIKTIDDRQNLTNNQILQGKGINSIECCNNSDFYTQNTQQLQTNPLIIDNIQKCQQINNLINLNRDIIDNEVLGDNYNQLKTFCNFYNNSENLNKKGTIFTTFSKDNKTIFDNSNISINELIQLQNNYKLKDPSNKINVDNLNNELKTLNVENYNDNLRKINIQEELKTYYNNIDYIDINYKINDNYIADNNEVFNCFGNKELINQKLTDKDMSYFNNNNRFGVSSDAQYKTEQDYKTDNTSYPSEKQIELELKQLPKLNQYSVAPVSIINQYMNTINRFYEKQLDNMMGPWKHSIPKILEFDNDSLNINNKFFTNDINYNYQYKCRKSVTGNKLFDDCGPSPYNN